eukprot:CAMPEP_0206143896 /NCGR_PEP_ID=MMETSP1473-20131121/22240_1 /ASSEMBLY_ACC=CAM_ASM_001109 /TAXON_ID=1461547 /ORGANISM="Stichococcus sp, Strain RCC1054" /LENGTH=642 /DNA_ID=CAMNT_0053539511 /DNA_START=296 /DNA_END=2220 /DNA_ORIENTATION=-
MTASGRPQPAPTCSSTRSLAGAPGQKWFQLPRSSLHHQERRPTRLAATPGDGLGLVESDPQLEPFSDHLRYRFDQYRRVKADIEQAEGSLAKFAKGYEIFGFSRDGTATVYREWAPTAKAVHLIGDFNCWSWNTPLERGHYGVWSVRLPDGNDGVPAVPHGSRVKVRLTLHDGSAVDRVPAWARLAQAPFGQMGAKFDGVHWAPPEHERYSWRCERPPRPDSLRIYEAHVGMSSEEEKVASYAEFSANVLPRIKAAGYTAVQLMAVQEHAYYASFGYHVTNPFAPASRSGNPEELKALVDTAHGMGLVVLLDVVHSHISSNTDDGLAGFDIGQSAEDGYFLTGEAGYHSQWDSRLFNYRSWEVLRYLLSNLRWWLEEYRFDGFRFDGVTSMLYHHHGINRSFSGGYGDYFGPDSNVDAAVYLMLANDLVHEVVPGAITIAEDVSGMPGLGRPVAEGGVGFDFRLAMGLPDFWVRLLKERRDEHWSMSELVGVLCNRRYTEQSVGYVESHDQALVGDQTLAWRLMGTEMYDNMSSLQAASPVVARGCAMHCMIRALTAAIGGDAWLGFMGNEFGHPEWLDFPREGNGWSHSYCRRQWSLADAGHLRYGQLAAFERALWALEDQHSFLAAAHQIAHADDERQVL